MITEWFLSLWWGFTTWIAGLLPKWDLPAELLHLDVTVNDWFGQFTGIGVWVPWIGIGIAIALVLGAAVFNVGARLVLWLYSVIPVFGNGD